MNILQKNKIDQKGFTIVELMIALSVLSTLLLMSTFVMMQIGRLYTKGVNQSTTQNAARNIIDDLAGSVEFGSRDPVNAATPLVVHKGSTTITVNAICVGNIRYSYVLKSKLGPDGNLTPAKQSEQSSHVLWKNNMNVSGGACSPIDITVSNPAAPAGESAGYEMMPSNTMLTKFEAVPNAGIFTLNVWVAYGDSDLVNVNGNPTSCNSTTGSQFCSVSLLSTSISRRLE